MWCRVRKLFGRTLRMRECSVMWHSIGKKLKSHANRKKNSPNAKPSLVHCTCPAKFDTSQRRTASEPSNTCKSCGVALNFCCCAAFICATIIAVGKIEKKICTIWVRRAITKKNSNGNNKQTLPLSYSFGFLIKMHLMYECRKSLMNAMLAHDKTVRFSFLIYAHCRTKTEQKSHSD